MSDTQGETSQADASAASQADTSNRSQSQADLKTVKDLPDWAQKEIRDARREAADFRTKLAAIESSGKSESEKLAARLEALEQDNAAKAKAISERDARDAVKDAARKAGAPDTDLIYRVLKSDLEYDADGSVLNTKALIDDLKMTTPHLFKPATGKADGGSGNGTPAAKGGMNQWIRQAAGVDT